MEFIEKHPEYNWYGHRFQVILILQWNLLKLIQTNIHGIGILFHKIKILLNEFIEAHPEYPWDWDEIINNKFTENRELFMVKEARKYMAVYKD